MHVPIAVVLETRGMHPFIARACPAICSFELSRPQLQQKIHPHAQIKAGCSCICAAVTYALVFIYTTRKMTHSFFMQCSAGILRYCDRSCLQPSSTATVAQAPPGPFICFHDWGRAPIRLPCRGVVHPQCRHRCWGCPPAFPPTGCPPAGRVPVQMGVL